MHTAVGRIAALRVPRAALARAGWVGGPLILAMLLAKTLKLCAASGALTLFSRLNTDSLLANLTADLLQACTVLWQDVLISVLILIVLSAHFMLLDRKPAQVRSAAIWCLVASGYVLAGLDLAYFAVTHSSLTADEVLFALHAPGAGATLVSQSLSVPMVLGLIAPAFGLAIALEIRRRLRLAGRPLAKPGRTFMLGLLLWPAIGIACAAQATATKGVSVSALSRNLLTALPLDGMLLPLKRALATRKPVLPSALVPVLNDGPLELVPTPRTQPLNVIVVLLESARADAMSIYDPQIGTTPFLAEFARESLVVDDMYAVMPRSSSARLTTLSGQYPMTADIENRWSRDPERRPVRTSLPTLLRSQGYASAYFSPATLRFANDAAIIDAMQFDELVTRETLTQPVEGHLMVFGYEDKVLLKPLADWLDRRKENPQPFLLTVVTNVGHYPYGLPPSYERKPYPGKNGTHVKYLNCMRYMDEFMREFIGSLSERDLLEKSVLIVLGDHGEEFYEHGTYIRGHTLHDTVLRIPALVRLPQSAGRVGHITGLRQQIDVLPTVADALGFELKGAALPGRSMLAGEGHDVLFFSGQQPETFTAMRTGNHKYIYDFENEHVSVFDVDREPGERTDLSDEVSSDSVAQVEADLQAWVSRVKSKF